MKLKIKLIVTFSISLLLFLMSIIIYGIYLMEVEDHYGDLQEVFFISHEGDLFIGEKGQTGLITKTWKRIYITDGNNNKDLYHFSDQKIKIYRQLNKQIHYDITSKNRDKMIKYGTLKLMYEN